MSVYVTPAQTVTTQQLAIWNYLYEDSNNNNSVSGGAVINMPILTGRRLRHRRRREDPRQSRGRRQAHDERRQHDDRHCVVPDLEARDLQRHQQRLQHPRPRDRSRCRTCDGLHAGAYASSVGTTLDTSTGMPTVDFTAAYTRVRRAHEDRLPGESLRQERAHMNNDNSANIGALMFGSTRLRLLRRHERAQVEPHDEAHSLRTGSSTSTAR